MTHAPEIKAARYYYAYNKSKSRILRTLAIVRFADGSASFGIAVAHPGDASSKVVGRAVALDRAVRARALLRPIPFLSGFFREGFGPSSKIDRALQSTVKLFFEMSHLNFSDAACRYGRRLK